MLIRKNSYSASVDGYSKKVKNPNDKVRFLPFDEFCRYKEIGKEFFPQTNWSNREKAFREMYARWENGIIVFERNSKIIGYITLWPILKSALEQFRSGELGPDDLSSSIMPRKGFHGNHFWIMTAVAVKSEIKETRKTVILSLLKKFFSVINYNLPSTIIAHAATTDGENFLKRTGFIAVCSKPFKVFEMYLTHEKCYLV